MIGVCPYCHEPTGKTELGFIMAVHPEHQAGTPFWARWYRKQRDSGAYQSQIADLLLSVAESRMAGAGAGLAKMQALNKERLSTLPPAKKAVNPGLLRMQELNRLRKLNKEIRENHGKTV